MLPITAFTSTETTALSADQIPSILKDWEIAVMYGPHGAPISSPNTILIPSLPMSLKFTLTQAVRVFV